MYEDILCLFCCRALFNIAKISIFEGNITKQFTAIMTAPVDAGNSCSIDQHFSISVGNESGLAGSRRGHVHPLASFYS